VAAGVSPHRGVLKCASIVSFVTVSGRLTIWRYDRDVPFESVARTAEREPRALKQFCSTAGPLLRRSWKCSNNGEVNLCAVLHF
jgi:hypothetical protein